MKHICLLFFVCFVLAIEPSNIFAQEVVATDKTQNLDPEAQDFLKQLTSQLADIQVIEIGPYKISSPSDNALLWVEGPVPSQMLGISENNITVMSDSGAITVNDWNNDGIFERVSYDIIDSKGKSIGTVTDLDRDGEPDFKYMQTGASKLKYYARINDQWHLLHFKKTVNGYSWVQIDGVKKEVKPISGKYQFVESIQASPNQSIKADEK